jgi:hypothetical protein
MVIADDIDGYIDLIEPGSALLSQLLLASASIQRRLTPIAT